ncbi:non-ribosomal peptide synthetase [Streptomyces profundus]|uniref:non-ribosomal peptide synthetase n=1 Tax=Streptomyces profundus TaxID=2867410 RepID=UPI001D1665D7|nr:non-ribosomal peptide synthetase [Streptomyces sp. MA3_2.13]UED83918.1 amino acid adenylation domain-containing protein [Streptomyces sp. MA3_2.13]
MSGKLADVLPLAPAQRGLLFHALLDPEGPDPYLVRARFRVEGRPDPGRLRQAVAALLERHPNLRACFRHRGLEQPVALIPRRVEVPWHEVDLTGRPPDEAEAALERLLAPDEEPRLDLAGAPLLRATEVRRDGATELLLAIHHILLDGWSMPLLARELNALWRRAPLPPPAAYRDYLVWLRGQDQRPALDAWRDALAGLTPLTSQPAGTGPPGTLDVELPAELSAALARTARAAGCTANTVAQVAWALVLARTTGRQDVVFGGVVSGRPVELPGVERMIGLFLNTLPVRVRLRPGESVGDLLRRVRDEQLALSAHHQVQLADVQAAASPGGGPLFDTVLAFENYPRAGLAADAGPALLETRDATHYPLSVAVVAGTRWLLRLGHRGQGEAPRLADRLVRAFELLAATDLEAEAARIEVLPERERLALLTAGRGAAQGPPHPATVTARFAARRAETPSAPAVEDGERVYSYAELDVAASRLAARLAAAGAGPERTVALALPRSAELVVAQLATLRTGAAYLPIDPAQPPDRLARLLGDAGSRLLVAAERPGWLPPDVGHLTPEGPESASPPLAEPRPEAVACLLYTSGSTGAPKGVLVTHRGLVAFADDQHFRRPGHRRVLFHSPHTFDAASYEVWVPLLNGGTVVVAPPGPPDPCALGATIAAHRVTALLLTAELLRAVAEFAPEAVEGLTELWTGGDAVSAEAVARLRAHCPDTVVTNAYGPTEATVAATAHRCDTAGATPIGRPLDHARVHVLDARLRPLPAGRTGELYLAGEALARGYHGQPARTAERFVADPHGPPGTRMYRTGDLARWTPDGLLEFAGRADDQVKVRGFRVEPAEIEAALERCPDIARAQVTAPPAPGGGRRLAAHLVLAAGGTLDRARRHAAGTLPGHLLPTLWAVLDRLPLTPHGKVDRAALPEPTPAASTTVDAQPATDAERALCRAFASVLELPQVPVDLDFFGAGGTSLLALRLAARVEDELGVAAPLALLFEARTPAALARRLSPDAPETRDAPDAPETPAAPGSVQGGAAGLAPLLTLRQGRDDPPLFCVHSGLGLGWGYTALLPRLAPGRAVHTLQLPGLDDPGAPLPTTLGDLAEEHLRRLRALRPEGPYLLLGHSLGGLLAYEMAARLTREGERVDLLAVLDAIPATPEETTFPVDERQLEQESLSVLSRQSAPEALAAVGPLDRAEVFTAALRTGAAFAGQPPALLENLLRLRLNSARLARRWQPPEYRGRLLLCSAAREPDVPSTTAKADRWRAAGATVDAHELPCRHTQMLDPPYAGRIASLVTATLEAQPAQGGSP